MCWPPLTLRDDHFIQLKGFESYNRKEICDVTDNCYVIEVLRINKG